MKIEQNNSRDRFVTLFVTFQCVSQNVNDGRVNPFKSFWTKVFTFATGFLRHIRIPGFADFRRG